MMSKIRNCCCLSGNEERDSRDIIHDNTQQEVTHIMERTADYTGDTTAISTALSSPNDLVRKKSCEVHEEDDLFQSSIQEVNSSSSVIAEKNSQIVSSASEAFGRGGTSSKRTVIPQNQAKNEHLGITNSV